MNTENIKQRKSALRDSMLLRRASLDSSVKAVYDARVCADVKAMIDAHGFRCVHAYIPLGAEINISPLLNQLLENGIRVVCPKTLPKRKLENRILHSLNELETGIMGTRHPMKADLYDGPFDLIIVPGLAFDRRNFRLGYGGGYYDNFIVDHPEASKIGIFYPFQEVEAVPVEPHDAALNRIICFAD